MDEIIGPHCWILILQIGQLEGIQIEATEALSVGASIFALVLFALSLYAWSKRRQPALLIVSIAFLLFFASHVIEIVEIYEFNATIQVVTVLMNFIILAIVLRPKRKLQEQRPQSKGN
jgi:peptidoglycan/LPS O-acetylase OafA/YrhL